MLHTFSSRDEKRSSLADFENFWQFGQLLHTSISVATQIAFYVRPSSVKWDLSQWLLHRPLKNSLRILKLASFNQMRSRDIHCILQLRPGYVVSSFVFLLLGLASLSSSINLLVLRFMILSLEEDEEEFDLQDVTQNVITVDDEYLNGSLLPRRLTLRQPETVSVCSCTCYGRSQNLPTKWWQKLRLPWIKSSSGCRAEDDHFFNAETGSISNAKKNAIKRNSLWLLGQSPRSCSNGKNTSYIIQMTISFSIRRAEHCLTICIHIY